MSGWPDDKEAQVYAVMDAVNARDFDALSRIPFDPAFEFRPVSGIPLDDRNGQVWTWRSGKVWRNDAHPDPDEALEAAGLSK